MQTEYRGAKLMIHSTGLEESCVTKVLPYAGSIHFLFKCLALMSSIWFWGYILYNNPRDFWFNPAESDLWLLFSWAGRRLSGRDWFTFSVQISFWNPFTGFLDMLPAHGIYHQGLTFIIFMSKWQGTHFALCAWSWVQNAEILCSPSLVAEDILMTALSLEAVLSAEWLNTMGWTCVVQLVGETVRGYREGLGQPSGCPDLFLVSKESDGSHRSWLHFFPFWKRRSWSNLWLMKLKIQGKPGSFTLNLL